MDDSEVLGVLLAAYTLWLSFYGVTWVAAHAGEYFATGAVTNYVSLESELLVYFCVFVVYL
jgi:hypothetical protein